LNEYKKLGRHYDYVCCLYPTAPFVNSNGLKRGFDKLCGENRKSVFPVAQFSYPIWRSLKQLADGRVEMIWPNFRDSRSQDLEKAYHDAGQWYWLEYDSFIRGKKLFTENSGMIELSPLEIQDIDELTDWKMAELKYELLQDSR